MKPTKEPCGWGCAPGDKNPCTTCANGPAWDLAQAFHEAYERLAPSFGYKTREASTKPWADVPFDNKLLMVAVCQEMLARHMQAIADEREAAIRECALAARWALRDGVESENRILALIGET